MWKGEKKHPWKPRAQRESCLGLQTWRVGHTLSPAPASEFRPKSCLDIPQAPPTPRVPYSGAGSTFGPQPCHELALVPGDAPPSPLAALYLILPLLSMSSATTLAHTPALATPWSGCWPLGCPYSHCSTHQELV